MPTSTAAIAAMFIVACSVGGGDPFPGSVTAGSAGSPTSAGSSDDGGGDSGSTADGVATSAGSTTDATVADTSAGDSGDASSAGAEASDAASSESASSSSTDASGGNPLDPDLDIPDRGEECTTPGDLNECPGIAVCRFATTEHGLCESCEPCGNLNAPCSEGSECDILFACYAGRCTNFCTLGFPECGPVEDCLDVGHPTKGVCDPFA